MNNEVLEFFKLDAIDKKVLFWMMDNKPDEIKSWVKHIARQYSFASIKHRIDPEKLFEEVRIEL